MVDGIFEYNFESKHDPFIS